MNQTITVSQLNRYIKMLVAADPALAQITVKGELSNFTNHVKSGHFYFTLKDEAASIKGVMFRGNAQKVRFTPENGMNVILTGSVSVFERDGVYQLYCETMEPDGIGALALAFEQLKEKLSREGLFDPEHKRPLPSYPSCIGVVTSKTGAALQDIRNILARRWPLCRLLVIPALVQGEQAASSIAEGIRLAGQTAGIDLLIVGRGGGSIEDLWCFNDETVARAIFDCPIPVISAVGHEIDFTISDFVADLRAPTPSAAAELATPNASALLQSLSAVERDMGLRIRARLQRQWEQLKSGSARLSALSPAARIRYFSEELSSKSGRLALAGARLVKSSEERMLKSAAKLEALSPLRVLTRGYSITSVGERLVTSAAGLHEGDRLTTRFHDGRIESVVVAAEENNREEQLIL